ncbi:Single hybrid motif [Pseudocohnilembus persalinus]|uniref:Single hybrid motif n=1 Tax=Pseudocohnilembus persalinus TaxID=266149 RepID=A0A0V0QAT3_PSEPJ|nr:Single hybrid motif [Pseudocohnilembus persalinus]|eukprot:KRW99317.1 Single hybrid motif [Pseudocohnilembus persalinus]
MNQFLKFNSKFKNLNKIQKLTQKQNFLFSESYPAHLKIFLYNMMPEMPEPKVEKWYIREGDEINPGDVICDIETKKATLGYEMDREALEDKTMFTAKILVQEGENCEVGQCIAVAVENPEDIRYFNDYKIIS